MHAEGRNLCLTSMFTALPVALMPVHVGTINTILCTSCVIITNERQSARCSTKNTTDYMLCHHLGSQDFGVSITTSRVHTYGSAIAIMSWEHIPNHLSQQHTPTIILQIVLRISHATAVREKEYSLRSMPTLRYSNPSLAMLRNPKRYTSY